jgi:hypothetical protein
MTWSGCNETKRCDPPPVNARLLAGVAGTAGSAGLNLWDGLRSRRVHLFPGKSAGFEQLL